MEARPAGVRVWRCLRCPPPRFPRACARQGGAGSVSAQRGSAGPGGAGTGPTRLLGGRGRARAGEALAAVPLSRRCVLRSRRHPGLPGKDTGRF